MKKFVSILIIPILLVSISGCTTQKPVAQAPVYNITITDNSQSVVGDNNKSESKSETKSEQIAKPDVSSETSKSGSDWILFWIGLFLGIGLCVGGWFAYNKWIKK